MPTPKAPRGPAQAEAKSFADLQAQLLQRIWAIVNSGELTVRGLAARANISQPHLHHILHGQRQLTLATADQLLQVMGWTLADLLPVSRSDEVAQVAAETGSLRLPFLAGAIGPGQMLLPAAGAHYTIPAPWAALLTDGAAAELTDDPAWPALFQAGDIAILDQSEMVRLFPNPIHHYVIRHEGQMLVRTVRHLGAQVWFCGDPHPTTPREALPMVTAGGARADRERADRGKWSNERLEKERAAQNKVASEKVANDRLANDRVAGERVVREEVPPIVIDPGDQPLTDFVVARAVWFCHKERLPLRGEGAPGESEGAAGSGADGANREPGDQSAEGEAPGSAGKARGTSSGR